MFGEILTIIFLDEARMSFKLPNVDNIIFIYSLILYNI